jgi:steroid delta-isomerase
MRTLRVRGGELEPSGQWVYAWVAAEGVVYVGATALHPETRTWLHVHHDDPEVGRVRARYGSLAEEELDVVALPLAPEADRQRVRHGAVRLLDARGLLSPRHVCDPPRDAEPTPEAERLGELALLALHAARFNAAVRSGDFAPLVGLFAHDGVLEFDGLPVGPFEGRNAIAAAYESQPPDDELEVLDVAAAEDGAVLERFAWRRGGTGTMRVTIRGGAIARLVVAFD